MKAVILAGGFGTRLREVVADVPKPMAPINGEPFLALLIRSLKKQGVSRVVLCTHYMHNAIESFMGLAFEGVPITYAFEETPLYAGGAIVNAISTAKLNEPFVVLNGDTFVKADLQELYRQHLTGNAEVTMVLRELADAGGKGVVKVENGRIVKFGASGEAGKPGLINAGVWVMNPDILKDYALGQAFSFEKDFLQPRIPTQITPQAFVVDEYFIDIGVPSEYARAQQDLRLHL